MNSRKATLQKIIEMKIYLHHLFLFFSFFTINSGAFAQGDLLVYPTRLVFNGTQERVKVLNFRNQGQDSATYKLSYIENRMTENGSLEIVHSTEGGQLIASPYLRFYPRNITLAPGETQTVKVQLSRTNNLESGEYRSHLYIRAEEKIEVLEEKNAVEKPENISIQLKPIYGISIPNIIRIGNTRVESELKDISFTHDDGLPILSMKVTRNGNQSLSGSLEVVHINPEGVKTSIGKKTVVIYTPIDIQNIRMKLNFPEGIKFDSGKLAITFTDREGKKKLLATESFDLKTL